MLGGRSGVPRVSRILSLWRAGWCQAPLTRLSIWAISAAELPRRFGLNDRGEVVGYSNTKKGAEEAFVYKNGKMKSLGSLMAGGSSFATGINDRGQIVGWSSNKKGSVNLAFLYNDGRMKPIGKVPSEPVTHAAPSFSINNRCQVIGFSTEAGDAQLLSGGRLKDLGSLNGLGSVALGINNEGAVVGYSYLTPYRDIFHTGTVHPFVYQNGHMTDLGTLGGTSAGATAIANDGDIVGWSATTGDTIARRVPRSQRHHDQPG